MRDRPGNRPVVVVGRRVQQAPAAEVIDRLEARIPHVLRVLAVGRRSVAVVHPDVIFGPRRAGLQRRLFYPHAERGVGAVDRVVVHLELQQVPRPVVEPDIVHVQYLAPGLVPIIATRIARIKTVFATVHQPGRPYGRKAKLLLRFGARLCTSFFCVSKAAEESWFGNSKVFEPENVDRHRTHYTIYNAVDAISIVKAVTRVDRRALKESLGLDEYPIIIIVGRLRYEKGHAVLVDAVAAIATKIPDVKLLVIGDGPDRESLRLKAEAVGIASNIVWMGQKAPDEIFKLLAISDIAVVPSLFEGFGLTAAEAMAAGLPVVGSYIDGLREVVEQGVTGLLVPPGDSTALVKALTDLLKNPDRAKEMGAKGRERVRRLFSVERFSEAIIEAYS